MAARARIDSTRGAYLRHSNGQIWSRPARGIESRFLLSGFLSCGLCGSSMTVTSRDWKTHRHFAYACSYNCPRGRSVCGNGLWAPGARRHRPRAQRSPRASGPATEADCPTGGPCQPRRVSSDDLERELRGYLTDWRALLRGQPTVARQMIRKVVEGRIILMPEEGDAGRCYHFTGQAGIGRLILATPVAKKLVTPGGSLAECAFSLRGRAVA